MGFRARRAALASSMLMAALALVPAGAIAQPDPVERHSGIFDAARSRAVFFGGYDGGSARNDAWTLTLADTARWDALAPVGAPPEGRFGHSAIHDSARDRMVVFGGRVLSGAVDETWTLSLADPPAWTQLVPGGTPPTARPYHSAVLDSLRDRMLIFGGEGTTNLFNDVWALSLGAAPQWEQVMPSGVLPARRRAHSAILDPVRDRMVVFGGWPPASDVWELSLADTAWRSITPAEGGPGLRFGHTAVYDPAGDRMIVFGGSDGNVPFNDVWALSLADPPTWTRIVPAGVPPAPRFYHRAVYDPASNAMLVFGGFPLGDEPTWALSLGPAPRWSPYRPAIRVSATDLQLPAVTIGDTVSAVVSIVNDGLRTLTVTDVRLPGSEFRIDANPPVSLAWRDSVAGHLFLAPTQPGAIDDSVVIVSDDPIAPRSRVTVHGERLGLDFSGRVLGPPVSQLGQAMIVVVTPDSAVRIERGKLFYRMGGTGAPFDSVNLTPLATDFITAVPAEAVTERGVEFYVRVENSGFTATQPQDAPDSVLTQPVAPATSVEAVPRPNSGPLFLAGRSIDVDIVLPEGAVFVSGAIHYREGGAAGGASDTLDTDRIPGVPSGTIPAEAVGPRGVEYWVEVRTLGADLRYPPGASSAATIRTRVQGLTEASEHPAERYRLLSVPLDFGVDFAGSLDAILSDQLGTYDPLRWRAFLYAPDSLRNFEFSPARAAAFEPKPGRAFWLVTRDAHRVDTRPVDGFSTPTDVPFRIVLAPGWNMIGDPFDFPVAWADVIRNPAMVGDPVAFDPGLGTAGDYAIATPGVLVPFEGYFIENVSAGPETLRVPPREAAVTSASHEPTREAAADAWMLRLEARTDRAADLANAFGVHPDAADGFDPLDGGKPPSAPGPWVRIAFANEDGDVRPGGYRRDVRRAVVEGHAWAVELRSATVGEEVTIEIPADALPPGVVVRIVDRELDRFADGGRNGVEAAGDPAGDVAPLARCTVLSFGPGHPYRLEVIAGTEAYVAGALERVRAVPSRLTLDPVAPNPFRTATRIRFGLPRATRVTAEVFNILGARVATLLDDALLEPGRHALIWDGRNARGDGVPSGVYLLRVVAGDERRSGRLVLVR